MAGSGDTRRPWDEGPEPGSLKALLDSLDPQVEPDVLIRCRVLRALAAHGGAPQVPAALVAALEPAREPAWHARAAAVRSLTAIGAAGPQVLTALLAALDPAREPAWYVRAAAARSLGRLGGTGPRPLQALRASQDPRHEPDPGVRAAAAETLRALGRDETAAFGPALSALVESLPADPRAAREREAVLEAGRWLHGLRDERMSRESLAASCGLGVEALALLERGLEPDGPTVGLLARLLDALDLRLSLELWERPESLVLLRSRPRKAAPGDRQAAAREAVRKTGRLVRRLRATAGSKAAVAEAAGATPARLEALEAGETAAGPSVALLARLLFACGCRLSFERDARDPE